MGIFRKKKIYEKHYDKYGPSVKDLMKAAGYYPNSDANVLREYLGWTEEDDATTYEERIESLKSYLDIVRSGGYTLREEMEKEIQIEGLENFVKK